MSRGGGGDGLLEGEGRTAEKDCWREMTGEMAEGKVKYTLFRMPLRV
ncbi:MAG: hypothetical protein KAT70_05460 [Thermoplasmata archaeon]|nr:hypothetical protein [Thermoplasmata archaeon]